MSNEEYEDLMAYCDENSIHPSDFIRGLISNGIA